MPQNRKLLLVDDDSILLLGTQSTLERHGYEVQTTTTGEKAVELVRTDPSIDMVLMDIDLGRGIDGTEAAEIILQDRDLPLIFVSSHSEPEVVEKTEGITSYGYVVKNSGEMVLFASIKMAFRLHEARREILESRKQLQDIADSVPGLIYQYQLDPDGNASYAYMSEGVRDFYGVSSEEVTRNPGLIAKAIPKEDLDEVFAAVEESRTSMRLRSITHRVIHGDGSVRWMEASSKPHLRSDGSTVWNGIALDVTARKEAELALAEQAEFVHRVTERTPLLLYVYDVRAKRNIWSNESHKHYFSTISEKPAERLSLDDLTQLCEPGDLQQVVALTGELVASGANEGFDHPIRLRNGEGWRHMMLNVAPFERDSSGQIIRVIGTVTQST